MRNSKTLFHEPPFKDFFARVEVLLRLEFIAFQQQLDHVEADYHYDLEKAEHKAYEHMREKIDKIIEESAWN